jgi:phosphoenolpyruvate-protein kinase (PTS system EI component)
MLLAHTIASAEKVDIPVSICGELAGDPALTRLLLGMGLRQFSMHPAQILSVKQKIMQSNCCRTGADRSPPVAPRGAGEDSRATRQAQLTPELTGP